VTVEDLEQDPDLGEFSPEPESDGPPTIAPPHEVEGQAQVNYNDRVVAIGFTGAGKSELVNVLWSGMTCQRLLVDNKREFAIPDVAPVSDPGSLDWSEPVLHFRPHPGRGTEQYEELFEACMQRRGLSVAVHELSAVCGHQPNRVGNYTLSYLTQGRALGLGWIAGTQRPFRIPVSALSEAEHIFEFPPQLARMDDHRAAAEALSPIDGHRLSADDLTQELAAIEKLTGPYSFLWKDRRVGQLQSFPPLPEQLRHTSIVHRTEDA